MPADEHVRRSFDALAARLREDISRQLDAMSGELAGSLHDEHARALAAADEERARALALAAEEHKEAIERAQREAREQAERESAERHASTMAEAEANARREGREEGRREGLSEGRAAGLEEGRLEGRAAGLEEGRREGAAEAKEAFALTEREAISAARAEAFEDARADALAAQAAAVEAARAEAFDAAQARALDVARAARDAGDLAASERLVEAIRLMDRGKSLSEILDTLVSCAGREAARVGVLLVRGNSLRGWRFIGFGPALDERTDFETPMADAGIISDAVRTGATASGDSASHASAPSFASLPPGRETLALPVPMGDQIVAVLYADQGDREMSAGRMAWPAALEVMTRHAARSLEAITAVRAAQVLTERPDVSATAGGDNARATRVAPVDRAEEEQSARRYARLLISEIKLYHEPAVIAGRREGNLTERLGGEIARARVLYEQRVPAAIRQGGDYFHEELVRTLADGDATLLTQHKG